LLGKINEYFGINFYLIYFSLSATQRKVTKEKSPLRKWFRLNVFCSKNWV